jgi:hypothetical protein
VKYDITWDLATIPQNVWRSEAGRRAAAARTTPSGGRNGGRPKIPTACAVCGQHYLSAGEATRCARRCNGWIRAEKLGRPVLERTIGYEVINGTNHPVNFAVAKVGDGKWESFEICNGRTCNITNHKTKREAMNAIEVARKIGTHLRNKETLEK